MLMTIGTNVAWILFLLTWGLVLMSNARSYQAELEAVDIPDDVTDSNEECSVA
jgi:hypothetical protein